MKEICFYCGEEATTVDHIVPRANGGTNTKSNLVPCCKLCNSTKGDAPQEVFIEFLKFVKENNYSLKALSHSQRKMMKYRFLKKTGLFLGGIQSSAIKKEFESVTLLREERLKALENL